MRTLPLVLAIFSPITLADDYTIIQHDKEFSRTEMTIKVGDNIHFVNDDPFFHNVYSLSEAKKFDLGFYRQGLGKLVTFDQAGEVLVECAIHPNEKLKITVEP